MQAYQNLLCILKHRWGGPEDWPGFEYLANSFRSLVPLLEAYGIATADELDVDTLAERIQAEVAASKRPIMLPTAYHGVCSSNNIDGSTHGEK